MSSHDAQRWTIGFGTWLGVPVRVHMLLVLFALLTLAVAAGTEMLVVGATLVGVLVLSVAAHEAAHAATAIRLGGEVDGVVLSPIGGLQSPRVPDEPEPQLFVAMIGPIVNLAVVISAAGALAYLGETNVLLLCNPIAPVGLINDDVAIQTLNITVWVNASLFLLNLIPVYPFDGGPALRATLWPLLGRRSAAAAAAQTARVIAILLLVAPLVADKGDPQAVMPLWAPLATLAVFVLFSAQQDLAIVSRGLPTSRRRRTGEPLADSAGPDAWERDDEMVLVEASEGRQGQQEQKRLADEASEDARVDAILERLHSLGPDELTAEDRKVLQRASRRYRDRRRDRPSPD